MADDRKKNGRRTVSDLQAGRSDLSVELRRLYRKMVNDPVPERLRQLADELQRAVDKRLDDEDGAARAMDDGDGEEAPQEDGSSKPPGRHHH